MHVKDEFRGLSNDEVRTAASQRHLPFAVAIPNVSSMDLNPGGIIRTACALGAQCVFLFGKRKYDRRPTIGTHHYIDVLTFAGDDDVDEIDWAFVLQTVRLHDYTPIVIEQGGSPLHQFDPSFGAPVCLILGAELLPIPRTICDAERCYSIPQPGVGRSLNTAVAASIAMYHVTTRLHTL